jgi:hypothetical protein
VDGKTAEPCICIDCSAQFSGSCVLPSAGRAESRAAHLTGDSIMVVADRLPRTEDSAL